MGPLVMRLLWLAVGRVSRICWEKKITEEKIIGIPKLNISGALFI